MSHTPVHRTHMKSHHMNTPIDIHTFHNLHRSRKQKNRTVWTSLNTTGKQCKVILPLTNLTNLGRLKNSNITEVTLCSWVSPSYVSCVPINNASLSCVFSKLFDITLATSSNLVRCNEPNGYQPWKTIVVLSSVSLNPIIPLQNP